MNLLKQLIGGLRIKASFKHGLNLESWLDVPSILKSELGNVEGFIQYGIRLPIRPGTEPLHRCKVGSKEKVEGQDPQYWFLGKEESVKIQILAIKYEDKSELVIEAYSSDKFFDATIYKGKS